MERADREASAPVGHAPAPALAGLVRAAASAAAARLADRAAGASVAVGHDLVYVPAFAPLVRPRFIARAFTPREAAAARRSWNPAGFLALRWAAKEAAYKALCELAAARGLPLQGLASFRHYEVVRRAQTRVPALRLRGGPGRLVGALARTHCVSISLSLSDEEAYAAAVVVIACVPRLQAATLRASADAGGLPAAAGGAQAAANEGMAA